MVGEEGELGEVRVGLTRGRGRGGGSCGGRIPVGCDGDAG